MRYWVGGTGSWSDYTSHWSASSGGSPGASLPISSEDVTIDALSGFGSGGTITIDVVAECLDFTANSGHNYTIIDGESSFLCVYGSLIFESGITIGGTLIIDFNSTISGKTITSNGVSFYALDFLGVGGEWKLQDDLSCSYDILLDAGTFDVNDFNLNVRGFQCSGTSYYKTLKLGSGIITVRESWNFFDPDYLTLDAETSTIKLSGGEGAEFNGAGKTYNNIWFSILTGIADSNTFNDFKIDEGLTVVFTAGTTQTVSSFTAVGNS
jgi:hypothetical protein